MNNDRSTASNLGVHWQAMGETDKPTAPAESVCVLSRDGEYVGGHGFSTLAELIDWVKTTKYRREGRWFVMLTAGYYEVTLEEFRWLAMLKTDVRGAGLRGPLATVIRLSCFDPDDLEEIGKLTKHLAHRDVRVEV